MILKDVTDKELAIIGGISVVAFLVVRHLARTHGILTTHYYHHTQQPQAAW